MTQEELKTKLAIIDQETKLKRHAAFTEFAQSNNPHQVGDIITDHIGSIKIETMRMHVRYEGDFSYFVYFGSVLKVNGQIRVDRRGRIMTRDVYQSNINRDKVK